MMDVLNMDYVRTARAKGLSERNVIYNHALRNAMINIVTIIGLQITALVSGIVIVEVVFGWPGLGRLALNAVLDRDYPLLQGTVFTVAVVVTLVNLLVDLLYFFLDPRIEHAYGKLVWQTILRQWRNSSHNRRIKTDALLGYGRMQHNV
jgi:peptide/nickel transport system permease protein